MNSSNAHAEQMNYRPDIDGLRAIAVLSVVAFHAFPTWMRGGFIGVDIFFVISGYLISSIIFNDLNNGTFSFKHFYARRIKRIFPALLIVSIFCFIFGWYVLLADEFSQLGKHISAGAGFISNFILWKESGYFDVASETKPLLHLWSLGIEEQFYIIWPLLVWSAWKRKFNLLTVIFTLSLVSFYLNLKGINKDQIATFYSPQTRFWELMVGSLLAAIKIYRVNFLEQLKTRLDSQLIMLVYSEKQKADGKALANAFSIIGLCILLLGFCFIDKHMVFPGAWALIPVVGAFLIISAGPLAWANRLFLANKITVWFGLISFPLYLWHWPLLSFTRIISSKSPSPEIRIVLVVISILLAWLTYQIVERPIRLTKGTRLKVLLLTFLMLLLMLTGFATHKMEGLKNRSVNHLTVNLNSGNDGGYDSYTISDCGISDEKIKKLFQICAKDKDKQIRYALIGDSKAAALFGGLVRTSQKSGWLLIGGHSSNGSPTPRFSKDPKLTNPLTVAAFDAVVNNKEIKTVVIVSAARGFFKISDGVVNGNLSTYDYTYFKNLEKIADFTEQLDELDRAVIRLLGAQKK